MKRLFIIISLVLVIAIVIVFSVLLGKSKRSLLVVKSNPSAEVLINGKVSGTTPLELELIPGKYQLELSYFINTSKRISYKTVVELEPKVMTILQRSLSENSWQESGELLTLRPIVGNKASITVITTPPEAKVLIDKVFYRSPITISPVSLGNHILIVTAPNFVQYESVIKAQAGFDVTAFIDLANENKPREPQVTQNQSKQAKVNPTTVGFLRVRQEANTESAEITQVKPGDIYPVVAEDETNTWVKLLVNGQEGWVNKRYITLEE